VASFVISPTLIFALFDPVVADAAATIADVATTTTRSATALRFARIQAES
jgi:uncharacterized membrane protein YfcA